MDKCLSSYEKNRLTVIDEGTDASDSIANVSLEKTKCRLSMDTRNILWDIYFVLRGGGVLLWQSRGCYPALCGSVILHVCANRNVQVCCRLAVIKPIYQNAFASLTAVLWKQVCCKLLTKMFYTTWHNLMKQTGLIQHDAKLGSNR